MRGDAQQREHKVVAARTHAGHTPRTSQSALLAPRAEGEALPADDILT